jgi:hypothetical protein
MTLFEVFFGIAKMQNATSVRRSVANTGVSCKHLQFQSQLYELTLDSANMVLGVSHMCREFYLH